jgi:3-deoxy-manno-octulosonate cytidylyltransferase (CMP-KDO synthetase)
MKVIAVIPARMASTRFPGKPLADILGLPMIEHVRRRVLLCQEIHEVIVATCDKEILNLVQNFGGQAVMTSDQHMRCTDRVAEVMEAINADVVINVQGDEPLVNPKMFGPLLEPLKNEKELMCTNLMTEIESDIEFKNPNVVKTVCDSKGNALYFSRESIPSPLKAGTLLYKKYKQLGVIAFRNEFLKEFTKLPPTPLEEVESVDMLRAVEHGYKVRMVLTPFQVIGVDTPTDLEYVVKLMEDDPLFGSY